jgi:hypothetical protein
MDIFIKKFFLTLFFVFSTYFSTEPILPETIATITLLKCGAGATGIALAGRYIATSVKGFSEYNQAYVKRIPQFECCHDSSDGLIGSPNRDIQGPILKTELGRNLLANVKDIVFSKKDQHQSFSADSAHNSFDPKSACWNQTNVHAQQARGFFAKVNNNYYSNKHTFDKASFFLGTTIGSFITGMTCFHLVVKHKKD